MKKLFIIIFIFPVTLFSQDVQITSDNQKFLGVQSLYNFNKSYSFYPDKYEATGSVEYFKGGEIEKYFDENGTLRHEVFISDSEEQQNYLKITTMAILACCLSLTKLRHGFVVVKNFLKMHWKLLQKKVEQTVTTQVK